MTRIKQGAVLTRIQQICADAQEREEALNPAHSFIVQAPAGSGKTGLLVQRFLRLLSVVNRPESVVAITFTKKAASEMKQRVEEALQDADANREPDGPYQRSTYELAQSALENSRRRDWRLLSDTGRLQIQTIDSLCAMLTRQMPIVSEFGGTQEVIEDAGELYHLAARRTIRQLTEGNNETQELFHRLSLHFDNDIALVEGQIASMLQKRDQWHFLADTHEDQLIGDFCRVLALAKAALKECFREHAAVDFTEVTRAAIRALGPPDQPSDLLYSLDFRIEHLLVDEFQDTSRAQYDLIEALTAQWSEDDGHTLFLVGDPMQSIYRFREAEVSLFLNAWNHRQLGAVRLHPLRLRTNFRSTPEIVEWTYSTLAPILSEDDPAHGAVKLQPAEASRRKSKITPQIIPFVDDNGLAEAREIVEIVERCQGKGDIAILVRSRAHIDSILPVLRKAKIRYEAIEIDQLRNQQHILDLISLSRAVVHLGDRMSWLACLRAPWCGLTLSDLSALAEAEPNRTILDLLSDPKKIAALSSDGRQRAMAIGEIFSEAVRNVGRVALRDLIERLWLSLGGPSILREINQHEDVETFFNLIERFEEGGVIRDFSLLNERLEFLYAKPQADPNAVRVMTIHQAKGLEFDTVIIPKAAAPPRSRENELLIWTETLDEDGQLTLHLAAQPQRSEKNSKYDFVSDEIKKKETHELKRLLYVACTRAKNELYLLGNVKKNKAGTGLCKAGSNTLLGLIWSSVEDLFQREFRTKPAIQASLFSSTNSSPSTTLRRLPATWRTPRFDSSIDWQPDLRRATASAHEIPFVWASDTGRHVGSVVHEILKRVAQDGVEKWTSARIARLRPMVDSELMRLGVASDEQHEASAQVLRAVDNTLDSPRGRWILSAKPEAWCEWPVGGRIADQVISGTVDRMFRDEKGRLWIVDFKTSQHQGSGREKFLDGEQQRYRAQLESYGMLVSRLLSGPIFLGLYFPLLDGWREWELEKESVLSAHYTGV